jgi:5,10-methenyltetrahydrofolate synthetase
MMDGVIRTWRVRERARLKQQRMDLASAERALLTEAIGRNLDTGLERRTCRTLGLYWPIKGEFDLRHWAERFSSRKREDLALPVVVREHAPLEYWRWRPGDPMARGFWGIMVPERRELVIPDVVIAPLVGFCGLYRLGHGGGYFDRTLADLRPKPLAVGIGIEAARVEGYIPQPHDIPMDIVVTEAAIYRLSGEGSSA